MATPVASCMWSDFASARVDATMDANGALSALTLNVPEGHAVIVNVTHEKGDGNSTPSLIFTQRYPSAGDAPAGGGLTQVRNFPTPVASTVSYSISLQPL